MINIHFAAAVTELKAVDKHTGGLWNHVGAFVMEQTYLNGGIPDKGTDIKDIFKAQEKLAVVELNFETNKNSTYKVVKSILVRCVAEAVPLCDGDGKLRGKTELEEELSALKAEKTPLEKIEQMCAQIEKECKKLITPLQFAEARELVGKLHGKM